MALWIYSPTLGDPVQDSVARQLHRYLSRYETRVARVRNPHDRGRAKANYRSRTGGCLRRCARDDTLFVIAHGSERGPRRVGANRRVGGDVELKAYDPAALARTLSAEGLALEFRDVRLIVCGAGTPHADLGEPFAQILARAMGRRGYVRIRVTAYAGSINVDAEEGIRVYSVAGGRVTYRDRQDSSRTYGPRGTLVEVDWKVPGQ